MRKHQWLVVAGIVLAGVLVIGGIATGFAMGQQSALSPNSSGTSAWGTYGPGVMATYAPGYGPDMMGPQGMQGYGMMGGRWGAATPQGTPVTGVTQVTMQSNTFEPASIQVRAGTTVTWTNQDSVPHTVTFQRTGMQGSGLLAHGQTFTYTFTTPGTYTYLCTVHPTMVGTVVVTS